MGSGGGGTHTRKGGDQFWKPLHDVVDREREISRPKSSLSLSLSRSAALLPDRAGEGGRGDYFLHPCLDIGNQRLRRPLERGGQELEKEYTGFETHNFSLNFQKEPFTFVREVSHPQLREREGA